MCGLPTASIARLLLLSEPAVAQRIVRAKRKIRDAGIRLRVPDPGERPGRLASVLRAIYLTFTEGHSPHGTTAVVGKPLDHWFAVIDTSGLTRHNQVVAMLKADHGLAHGAAHRLSLLARQRQDSAGQPHDAGAAAPPDPADVLYAGAKAGLRPPHDALLRQVRALGPVDIAPKKGYVSLRRRKQFAMIQPSTTSRIDLGLILPAGTPAAGRLEPAATFNPLFTHRVRITAATDLDDDLRGWLATAYSHAG